MRLQRIAFIFLTLFATATLPVLSRSLGESQVLAQAVSGRKAEAGRLFERAVDCIVMSLIFAYPYRLYSGK
jgi:hypothetical protein